MSLTGPSLWTGRALQAESDDLEKLVLRFSIRPIDGAFELLAIMDIRARSISFASRPRRPDGPPDHERAGETFSPSPLFQLADLGGKANSCRYAPNPSRSACRSQLAFTRHKVGWLRTVAPGTSATVGRGLFSDDTARGGFNEANSSRRLRDGLGSDRNGHHSSGENTMGKRLEDKHSPPICRCRRLSPRQSARGKMG